jgi:5'(3')-deoxyribonucleotidase
MIVYIDMDDVLCNFSAQHKKHRAADPSTIYPQSQYGFFANLPEIENAVDTVKDLIACEKYDTYILTAPSVLNPLCYTEKRVWIEQKFGIGLAHKLIISPNKSLLKGHYLIDDNISGKGQEGFEGEVIHFGQARFPDWKAVREYLGF